MSLFFDSLEGVAEAVTKAVLRLLFTFVTDSKKNQMSSLVQLKQGRLLSHIASFPRLVQSQRKNQIKVRTHSPVDAFDPSERQSMWRKCCDC